MKTKIILSTLAASIVLVACGSNPVKNASQKPGWIVNEPVRSGHVYGVGSAEIYTNEAEALHFQGPFLMGLGTARLYMRPKAHSHCQNLEFHHASCHSLCHHAS